MEAPAVVRTLVLAHHNILVQRARHVSNGLTRIFLMFHSFENVSIACFQLFVHRLARMVVDAPVQEGVLAHLDGVVQDVQHVSAYLALTPTSSQKYVNPPKLVDISLYEILENSTISSAFISSTLFDLILFNEEVHDMNDFPLLSQDLCSKNFTQF